MGFGRVPVYGCGATITTITTTAKFYGNGKNLILLWPSVPSLTPAVSSCFVTTPSAPDLSQKRLTIRARDPTLRTNVQDVLHLQPKAGEATRQAGGACAFLIRTPTQESYSPPSSSPAGFFLPKRCDVQYTNAADRSG
jgi:hypothetical protein